MIATWMFWCMCILFDGSTILQRGSLKKEYWCLHHKLVLKHLDENKVKCRLHTCFRSDELLKHYMLNVCSWPSDVLPLLAAPRRKRKKRQWLIYRGAVQGTLELLHHCLCVNDVYTKCRTVGCMHTCTSSSYWWATQYHVWDNTYA